MTAKPAATKIRYTRTVQWWLGWVALVAATDAYALLAAPNYIETGAYEFAGKIAPQWVWGVVQSSNAALIVSALIADATGRHASHADTAARWAVSLNAVICFVFGLSIFVLTLRGIESAITGASKWWTISAAAFYALTRPTWLRIVTEPQEPGR